MDDLKEPAGDRLLINELEYLEMTGLNVMLAHDFYAEGHQGGVGIIQNGVRVATNGDLRLEPMPGQWSPVPTVGKRIVDRERQEISVRMGYPDDTKNRKGFNPIDYPDLELAYTLKVRPEGRSFRIIVDLDSALPAEWIGKVGLNLELFPGILFGKSFATADGRGVFPRQANANSLTGDARWVLATGRKLIVAPESEEQRMTIESTSGGPVQLFDGRGLHNNGWFVVRGLIEEGASKGAIDWLVTPNAIPGWKSRPVVQVSQVGYHPNQPKAAVIELDRTEGTFSRTQLLKICDDGGYEVVVDREPIEWGRFLRYNYLRFDFSDIRGPGMYAVRYGDHQSSPFQISPVVFADRVWQPTIETFLPVQMCHMRVNENYRVWHGACHLDDATMAPTDFNHVDGYRQGSSTLTEYQPGDHVPGLACGGWHDAGDYDLRVESQADTVHGLALAFEEFGLTFDNTTIDQDSKTVELFRPDGKPDVLQQIEHGCLAIVGGYNVLGRLYRGIIERTLRQYTHLGDAATVTDNQIGSGDDRWVFTEENPHRELGVCAALAAAARALGGFNEPLAGDCLRIAQALYRDAKETEPLSRLEAAIEMLKTTGDAGYADLILSIQESIAEHPDRAGWLAARALPLIPDEAFTARIRECLEAYRAKVDALEKATPYGLPYQPHIWGAGWGIQRFGVKEYWLHKALPDLFSASYLFHAVNFVLGCHPGPNPASFVSGVGAVSLIPGYGVNRADNSYIPGGIGSGTALIRPDFPELLEWPYLWQQTEYCVGYATSDFVFLIAAADHLLNR
jgi:hypothetical protein